MNLSNLIISHGLTDQIIRLLRRFPFHVVISLLLLLITTSSTREAIAYFPGETHAPLVDKAGTIFAQRNWWNDYHTNILSGVVNEDLGGDVLYGCGDICKFNSHFWDPDDSDGVWTLVEVASLCGGNCKSNALRKVIGLTAKALEANKAGNYALSFDRLGHISHLLQDQSVPAHAHEEPHAEDLLDPDYFEYKMKTGDDNFQWWGDISTYLLSSRASTPIGLIDIPPDVCQKFYAHPEWKQMWEKWEWKNVMSQLLWAQDPPCPTCGPMLYDPDGAVIDPCSNAYGQGLAKIAYLMYTTNQYSDWWDDCRYVLGTAGFCSGGESNLPYFSEWIDYNEYTILGYPRGDGSLGLEDKYIVPLQGHYTYRYGMRATATLFQVFQEMVSPSLTVTSLADPGDGTCDESECTLREAIQMAAHGATIRFDDHLSGGAITLQDTLVITKPLTIDASPLLANITISGNSSVRVFYVNSDSVVLTGLDISNGRATSGGGLYVVSGSLSLSDCAVYGNHASSTDGDGGGIYIADGQMDVADCTYSDNISEAGSGGAIANHSDGAVRVYNSTFINNQAETYGGGIANLAGTLTVVNSLFTANSADWGGAVANASTISPILTNVTISKNSAVVDGGGIHNNSGATLIMNNAILWANTPNQIVGPAAITYSDIQGGYGGDGNINQDPKFVDASAGNFRLQPDSPAIDAGSNAALPEDELDLDGDTVTLESVPFDLDGAPRISDVPGVGNDGNEFVVNLGAYEGYIRFVKPVATGQGNCTSWENACDLQTALAGTETNYEVWVAAGVYYPGDTGDRQATFWLKNGLALYGGFAGEETSREQRNWRANPTILSGDIDKNDVTVNGVVIDTANIMGSNAYRVVSAETLDDPLILDGFIITGGYNDQAVHPEQWGGGLFVDAAPLTMRNVRLEGNLAAAGGGMFLSEQGLPVVLKNVEFYSNTANINGGGLHTYSGSNPTLTDVTFSGNSAVEGGGGMINYYDCNPTLIGVTFAGNDAQWGGGMANLDFSRPKLVNATFFSNSAFLEGGGMANRSSSPTLVNTVFFANESSGVGGGMANTDSKPTLTNVTFFDNTAPQGGGMYSSKSKAASRPIVTNSIFWGNNGGQIVNDEYTFTFVTYSDVEGGYGLPEDHNIDADPLFVDAPAGNLRLGYGSPAIDAGNNAAVPADIYDMDSDGITSTEWLPFDLNWFRRIVDILGWGSSLKGFTVDMGAYEYGTQHLFLPLMIR